MLAKGFVPTFAPYLQRMALLFEPLVLKSISLKNRIAVSPMCQYSADDGCANDWHLVHLGSRAVGGAALILQEATAVSPEGRISTGDLGIWKAAHIPALQRITRFIEMQGAVPGIQLAHAGRKASHDVPWRGGAALTSQQGAWPTVGASAQAFSEHTPPPVALDVRGIEKVIADFKAAAQRAFEAGYKVLEIHAAHGYLLHSFYSPLSNHRTDAYGGSFNNRIRLVLEVTAAVQEVWPKELPILVRISATDWITGGWTVADSVQLALRLKAMGVDLIDCSTGGNTPVAEIPAGPLYQVGFAHTIKQEAGILTGAVGIITQAAEAENILQQGQADLVVMGRELLRDPYFPLHAAKELAVDLAWPDQYQRAKR